MKDHNVLGVIPLDAIVAKCLIQYIFQSHPLQTVCPFPFNIFPAEEARECRDCSSSGKNIFSMHQVPDQLVKTGSLWVPLDVAASEPSPASAGTTHHQV